jgi:outer membrane biosynthesis protein TonB
MADPIKVRTVPAFLTPLTAVGRDLGDLFRNPVAFIGGVLGSGAFMGGAFVLAMYGLDHKDEEGADDDDELEMEFMPGELVRKGEKIDPQDIPEKIIVEETVAAAAPTETKITTDEKAKPDPKPEKVDKPKPDKPSTEAPDPNKKGAKESDKNREGNKQYDTDIPTVKDLPGDPFGSADGWSDMAKDGDPWATAVLAALNGMKVGAYAAQGSQAVFKFQLVLCADGSIDDVRKKQSTNDPKLDGAIINALETLKLPKAPPDIAKQLSGKCKKIPYEFTWAGKGGSGKVK